MSAAERIAVMEGELEGIDLVEVLQVVGIGRQYTGVELRSGDQTVLGTVFIKAGKVVTARAGHMRGRDAFFQLFQLVGIEARRFFHVFRTETPPDLPEPIGSLGSLVLEALTQSKSDRGPHKVPSGVIPRPVVVHSSNDAGPERAARPDTKPSSASAPDARSSGSGTAGQPAPTAGASSLPPLPPSSRRRAAAASSRGAPSSSGGGTIPAQVAAAVARRPATNDVEEPPSAPTPARAESVTPIDERRSVSDASASRSAGEQPGSGGGETRVVLGVASPKGGSGKTTISLNLSLSFARQGRSVILVDADINGDVLSAIAGRTRAQHGALDVLTGKVDYEAARLGTVLPNFSILPAVGPELPDDAALLADHAPAWKKLLAELSSQADIVLVDGPAGMFGGTREFLAGCTHVLGVLQAEVVASRSFGMFERALRLIPAEDRPEVVGVVLNMLQARHQASVHVLDEACRHLPKRWLLDTAIPRSDAFLEASEEGLPLRWLDDRNPPAVSWLFDTLAGELGTRLGLDVEARKPRRLLL